MKVDNRIVFGVAIAGLVAYGLFMRSCGVKSVIVKAGKTDTIYAKPDTVTFYSVVPEPYAVLVKGKDGKIVHDTTLVEKPLPSDTLGSYLDYYRTYAYEYNERVKYGQISIYDTISQNMFLGRGVMFVADSVPIVTKRELIQQPKKIILYGTLSGMGNRKDILYGFGGGLALKGLNDKIYGVELKYLKGGSLYYEGRIMLPIRIGKKK